MRTSWSPTAELPRERLDRGVECRKHVLLSTPRRRDPHITGRLPGHRGAVPNVILGFGNCTDAPNQRVQFSISGLLRLRLHRDRRRRAPDKNTGDRPDGAMVLPATDSIPPTSSRRAPNLGVCPLRVHRCQANRYALDKEAHFRAVQFSISSYRDAATSLRRRHHDRRRQVLLRDDAVFAFDRNQSQTSCPNILSRMCCLEPSAVQQHAVRARTRSGSTGGAAVRGAAGAGLGDECLAPTQPERIGFVLTSQSRLSGACPGPASPYLKRSSRFTVRTSIQTRFWKLQRGRARHHKGMYDRSSTNGGLQLKPVPSLKSSAWMPTLAASGSDSLKTPTATNYPTRDCSVGARHRRGLGHRSVRCRFWQARLSRSDSPFLCETD